MLPALAAMLITASQGSSNWGEKFLAFGETCKKWGITFKVESGKELEAEEMPGRMEIAGNYNATSHELSFKLDTSVGYKHETELQFGTEFKVGPDGVVGEGRGGVIVDGFGMVGKFSDTADEGPKFDMEASAGHLSIGFQGGRSDEGPLAFGMHFGPLTVEVDPTKYYERLKFMGPTLLQTAGQKIGGVSLEVDGQALAAAMAQAPQPPVEFTVSRKAVSVKSLISTQPATLGALNDLQGVVVDTKNQDVFLIGAHDDNLPEIPTERVATVERAVYEAGMHPFISIDPQAGDWTKPHRARIGNVPDDLRKSSLIQTMLAADYAMKQIVVGTKSVDGVPATKTLMEEHNSLIVPTRFWINPAPLQIGDVRVSRDDSGRLYTIDTKPLILTEPMSAREEAPVTSIGSATPGLATGSDDVQNEEAATLTADFGKIEQAWPESSFGAALQDLQLTNLFTLLASAEREPWTVQLLGDFKSVQIPDQDIPSEFNGLTSDPVQVDGTTTTVVGGVETEVKLPTVLLPAHETVAGLSLPAGGGDVPPTPPVALEPSPMSDDELAARSFEEAMEAFRTGDFTAAWSAAATVLDVRPDRDDAEYLLLGSMLEYAKGDSDAETAFQKELEKANMRFPNSARLWYLSGLYRYDLATRALPGFGNRWEDATTAFGKAITLSPSFAAAYAGRAKAEHRANDDDSALTDWSSAIERTPTEASYHFGRAGVLVNQGKNADALAELTAALTLDSMNARYLLVRAELRKRSGDSADALADAVGATKIAPTDWLTYAYAGRYRFEAGDDPGAIDAFDKGLALAPRDELSGAAASLTDKPVYPVSIFVPDLWENFKYRSGDYRDPNTFSFMAGAVPFDPQMLYLRGKAHFHLEHWKEAQADFEASENYLGDKKVELEGLIAKCKAKIG